MQNFKRILGRIAVAGLIVGAVGIAIITASPQIIEVVARIVPDLLIGTVTNIGTAVTVVGGAAFLGAGAMIISYQMGASDERAKLAEDVEDSQRDALDEDQKVAEEAKEASDEIESLQAVIGQMNAMNARINQLEKDRVDFLEQDNSRIELQAERDKKVNQRLDALEKSARTANGSVAENAPRFFPSPTKGAQIRRRTQNVEANESENQDSQTRMEM